MAGDALEPWWLAVAGGICATLVGAIGRLWSENGRIRRELAEANERIVHLQQEAAKRSDEHQAEHRRDLRRVAGLSTSIDPPPIGAYAPIITRAQAATMDVVRDPPPRPRRGTKKAE